jgi:uncharacterized protein UPF0547
MHRRLFIRTDSRNVAGFIMICVSMFLFLVAAVLLDQEEANIESFVVVTGNLVLIVSAVSMIIGLYLACDRSRKTCPECALKVERAERVCRYCGHAF